MELLMETSRSIIFQTFRQKPLENVIISFPLQRTVIYVCQTRRKSEERDVRGDDLVLYLVPGPIVAVIDGRGGGGCGRATATINWSKLW